MTSKHLILSVSLTYVRYTVYCTLFNFCTFCKREEKFHQPRMKSTREQKQRELFHTSTYLKVSRMEVYRSVYIKVLYCAILYV